MPKLSREALSIGIVLLMASAIQADAPAEPSFVVAAMRVEPKKWDKEHNFVILKRYATEAARNGAALVVTCEGFLDGYTGNPKLTPETSRERYVEMGEPLDGPMLKRVGDLARELKIYLSVGFPERDGDDMHNTVAVFSPSGEVVLHYSKTHCLDEPFNTPGNRFPVAATQLGTLGALICYDRRFPEVPRILALKGAKILLIPAYGEDGERNEALLRTRAWENSVWVVYVRQNQALVINPSGKIIARDKGEGDELVFARIDLGGEKGTGEIYERRSPALYREILELQTPANK
ncbi:MAG TPA: carbon-nitrogen hydrolase family protein [Lacipirellulaceae bacterium]|nr:carbon-nitrogen hydrolase family protein [Lacipirellulaceae bacterium]